LILSLFREFTVRTGKTIRCQQHCNLCFSYFNKINFKTTKKMGNPREVTDEGYCGDGSGCGKGRGGLNVGAAWTDPSFSENKISERFVCPRISWGNKNMGQRSA
jgi:hypothetical protein